MQKLTIQTVVGMFDKSKAGVAFVTKTGKPYKKATVKFKELGDKMVGMMVWDGDKCEVGQVVEGTIEEREWNGNKYYDLKVVSQKEKVNTEILATKTQISQVILQLQKITQWAKTKGFDATQDYSMPGGKVPDFVPNTPAQAAKFREDMKVEEARIAKQYAPEKDEFEKYGEEITAESIPF